MKLEKNIYNIRNLKLEAIRDFKPPPRTVLPLAGQYNESFRRVPPPFSKVSSENSWIMLDLDSRTLGPDPEWLVLRPLSTPP